MEKLKFVVVIMLSALYFSQTDARKSHSFNNVPADFNDYEQQFHEDMALLHGYTDARDYAKNEDWLDKHQNKRGLGSTGLKIYSAAILGAGVVHASSLALSIAKLGFDIWFNNHKCCGVHKSICDDYAEYSRIKGIVLDASAKVDEEWLKLENAETYLFALSNKNDLLHGAMVTLDSQMMKLVESLEPEIEIKIRNATYEMKRLVDMKNDSIANITIAEEISYNIFDDAMHSIMRAVSFMSDAYMVRWAVKKMRKYNSKYLTKQKTLSRLKVVTGMNGNLAKTKTYWTHTKTAGKAMLYGGTTILTVFASVQDILYVAKQLKICKEIADETKNALDLMVPEEAEVQKLLTDVIKMKNNLTSEFDVLKASYYNPDFQTFLVEVTKLVQNASDQSSEYIQIAQDISDFNTMIYSANQADTINLVDLLIGAFGKINQKMDCLTKKMNTINYATQQCLDGADTFDNIFINVQKQEVVDAQTCVDNGYITKDQIRTYLSDNMIKYQKEDDCILNNVDKKALVCGRWVNDETNADIAKLEGLTVEQVKWFIDVSKCPLAHVTQIIITSICFSKDAGQTKSDVSISYSKYDQSQIDSTYDQCEIMQHNKDQICLFKNYGSSLDEVYLILPLYPKDKVKVVYDTCPKPQMSPMEEMMVCNLKKFCAWGDPNYQFFITQYSEADVLAVYDACPVNGKKDFVPARFESNMDKRNLVTQKMITSICILKDHDKSKSDVLISYSKYDKSQIASIYDQCEILQAKKHEICFLYKNYGYKVDDLYDYFPLYPKNEVKAVHDSCTKPKLTSREKAQICRLKKRFPWGHSYYQFLIKHYGESNVKAVYDKCPVNGKIDDVPARFESKSDIKSQNLREWLEA